MSYLAGRIRGILALALLLGAPQFALGANCGTEGGRPCTILERIPSCNQNLVESSGKCVHPGCGRSGDRACVVTERIPSCDQGLVETGGHCLPQGACGAEGARACMLVERIPSCNANLVESGGKCVHPACGRKGDRACVITQRIPSCDQGLVESAGKCETAPDCAKADEPSGITADVPLPALPPSQPAPYAGKLMVGAGVSDITGPAAEVNMMGYADVSQATGGIFTRLQSRAFVIANPATGKRVVFVSVEVGQLFSSIKQGVLKRLAQRFGKLYDDRNVQIAATHTHSGPGGYSFYTLYNISTWGFIPQNYDAIVNGVTNSIVQAHERLKPATLSFNAGDIDRITTRNRSLDAFYLDPECNEDAERAGKCISINPEMTLLRVQHQGGPGGVITWFSIHNNALSKQNHLISSDHLGYAAYLFERLYHSIVPFEHAGDFVAAFPAGDEGDMSPNLGKLPFTPPGFHNSDYSRTHAANEAPDDFKALVSTGTAEFESARRLFDNANGRLHDVGTEIDYRHIFVRMPGYTVGGKKLCQGAMGFSFAAGAEDGPSGMPGLKEGMVQDPKLAGEFEKSRKAMYGVAAVTAAMGFPVVGAGAAIATAAESSIDDKCQYPKPVLFPTGKWGWTTEILPFQLLRVGNVAIAGVPGEMNIQAGHRLRTRILASLQKAGVEHVIITGLANEYSGYIATPEEYDSQQYEGASTMYGRDTFNAYLQIFGQLADSMAAGRPVDAGPAQPDLAGVPKLTLQTAVVYDDKRLVEKFGQVFKEPPAVVSRGTTVEAQFRSGHPKNGLRSNDTYLAVERNVNGKWVSVAWDAMPETRFTWSHDKSVDCLACSFFDARWDVPPGAAPGTYRIRHFGAWKSGLNGAICGYTGSTRTFEVK